MKESIITAILAIFSVILFTAAVTGIILRDTTAPVISLEGKNSLTYTEGENYDVLLKDMTAQDEEDGDVTESLRVSNIYVIANDKAMVVYVAKDEANNIGKLKREIRYQAKEVVTVENMDKQDEDETEDVQKPAPTQQAEALTGARVIMLQNEVTLKIGESFNIYRFIQRAVDVNGNDISRSMHIDGTYDMNVAGVYPLQIYALDGNGRSTNVERFTLTVIP